MVGGGQPAPEPVDSGGEPGVAKLRTLLVTPAARGLGVGAELVNRVLSFARSAGYTRVTLWTNTTQSSARRIYEAAGFTLTSEDPRHSFGHDLLGQDWTLDLAPVTAASTR
ncbi:GNAT family N-acetyltransferase [Nocardia fluminea]|uniref:GNAT family N-acetyltransferase n=1 Tax=Nocardia fluminea TaxID=134984 RepID=UPI00364FB7A6